MSYNISFKIKVENTDYYLPLDYCDSNITWNVGTIIRKSTGLDWNNEENNGFCKDIMPHIEAGLYELQRNGQAYKQYEPDNGWGSVEGTINFFKEILTSWHNLKMTSPELIDVTTFWIE